MTTTTAPILGKIVRHAGTAGQHALSVLVSYPGESGMVVTFTASHYGGPIVMAWPSMPGGVFVSAGVTDRIGSRLTPEWVRAFYGS